MTIQDQCFQQGQKLKAIYLTDGARISVGGEVDEIIIIMENGQMAGVPWFAVFKDGKMVSKWNAALVEGVEYL